MKEKEKQTAYFQLKIKIPAPKYTRTTWLWSPCSLKMANEHSPMHTRNNILYAMWNHHESLFQFVWFTGILSSMTQLKIRVMYSKKSPLISYSFSNTLVQNLITFQHIHDSQIYMLTKRATLYDNNSFDRTQQSTQRTWCKLHITALSKGKLSSFTMLECSWTTTFGSVKSL
jgi:hypothetical protein